MDNSRNDSFDTENFIREIEKRPAIWDLTDKEYANRDARRKSWQEVIDLICSEQEATDNEKKAVGLNLQRKWKSLRDCFSRELCRVKNLKSGDVAKRKNPYIYYKQLSFLQRVIRTKPTDTTINEAENEPEINISKKRAPLSNELEVEVTSTKRKRIPVEQQLFNVLQRGIEVSERRNKFLEDDEDCMFLLSLLKPLKRVPEHLRLATKMELMNVINQRSQPESVLSNPDSTNYSSRHQSQITFQCSGGDSNYVTHQALPNRGFVQSGCSSSESSNYDYTYEYLQPSPLSDTVCKHESEDIL